MGYVQDMKRNYSVWSVLGVGFSLTNSWFGISAALVTGINSGGPVLIIYGIILIATVVQKAHDHPAYTDSRKTRVGRNRSKRTKEMPHTCTLYRTAAV